MPGELRRDRRAEHNRAAREKNALRGGNGAHEKNARVYTAEYRVNRSDELLNFLLAKCNTSRNNVKALLSGRHVLVNGSAVTRHDFPLAKDDEVKISRTPIQSEGKNGNEARVKKPRVTLKILYENDEIVAVDKPAGLLSVESDKESECAFAYVLDYLRSKDKTARPFILHRIDKETSGVLIFAKNVKIHSMLRLKWNDYVKTREYYAVTEGKFEKKEGTIVSYLKQNQNNLVYSTHDPSGQKAITHYTVVKENDNYSLLRVTIDTGRKNQIRVHMHDAGHPIVGDDKYGYTKNPLGRLGLHASRLEFKHPRTGELISIVSPLPAAFHDLF